MFGSQDIAVVIPAYNCRDTIIRCLDSVFAQRAAPGEVIVVNDGSPDDCEAVLQHSQWWSRIHYICQANAGPAAARNTALNATDKPWVAFIDADDCWIDNNKLAAQINVVNQNPGTTLVDTFARVDWHGQHELLIKRVKQGDSFSQFLQSNVVNATSSVLADNRVIREVGGFVNDIRFGEDRLLWAQLARHGAVRTLQQVTVLKHNEEGNLTSNGERNYPYRVALVKRLLTLTSALKPGEVKQIWRANLHEFLRLAYQANQPDHYLQVFDAAVENGGAAIWLSKYGVLAGYARIFGHFRPFEHRKGGRIGSTSC